MPSPSNDDQRSRGIPVAAILPFVVLLAHNARRRSLAEAPGEPPHQSAGPWQFVTLGYVRGSLMWTGMLAVPSDRRVASVQGRRRFQRADAHTRRAVCAGRRLSHSISDQSTGVLGGGRNLWRLRNSAKMCALKKGAAVGPSGTTRPFLLSFLLSHAWARPRLQLKAHTGDARGVYWSSNRRRKDIIIQRDQGFVVTGLSRCVWHICSLAW